MQRSRTIDERTGQDRSSVRVSAGGSGTLLAVFAMLLAVFVLDFSPWLGVPDAVNASVTVVGAAFVVVHGAAALGWRSKVHPNPDSQLRSQ